MREHCLAVKRKSGAAKPLFAKATHLSVGDQRARAVGHLSSEPLPQATRDFFEPRFRHDFSRVRVRFDGEAARAMQARAYTVEQTIVFGHGEYEPNTAKGKRLLAHELTHVVQHQARPAAGAMSSSRRARDAAEHEADLAAQSIAEGGAAPPISQAAASIAMDDGPDAGVEGPRDAGVPLPGGIPPTEDELRDAHLSGTEPSALRDDELGPAIAQAEDRHDSARADALVREIDRRTPFQFGVGLPAAIPRGSPGNSLVTPEIALAMVENMVAGQPPFRPELGVGGASWFVTEGNPYTGTSSTHTIPVQTDLVNTSGGLRYEQSDLDRIYAEEEARARPEVEAQVREQFQIRSGRPAPAQLSRTLAERVARQLRGLAERRMWTRIGREVAASPRRVGEVILPANGRFSANPGRFAIIADATRIRLRGGLRALLDAIRASPSARPVPELAESAEQLARRLHVAGRVRYAFRIGGRILLVFAIANDLYQIVTAEDHLEATLVSASGWAGATAGAAAFSALWTPADVAGPWAWAGHGVGVLVSGAIGYWIGSETTRYVYRLIVRSNGQLRAQ
jgi:hypothetical protein